MKDAARNAQKGNTYKFMVGGNLKERENLEDTGPRWEANIILDLKHMEWEYV